MVESHRQEIAKLEALYASNPAGRVFVHLAEALRRAGEHERARSILEEGLARHPDSASGYVVLGRVLIDRGETQEAESAFRRALGLDDGNLVALRCLGDLARGGGRPEEALTYYRELVARNPASAGDSGLMRLLEQAQQSAAEASAAAAQQAAAEAAGAAAAAAAAALEPSDTVAPGSAGAASPAEPEFGFVELEALPGDLASFAGLAAGERAGKAEEPEPEALVLDDDVVVLLESSAASLELEELETGLTASPAEVNLLSALPDVEPEPTAETPTTLPGFTSETSETQPEETAEITLPGWTTEAPDLTADIAEESDAPEAADVAGDMDIDAAMRHVATLSDAAPYEVVPPATELTLVDDDSVRVEMAGADTSGVDAGTEGSLVSTPPERTEEGAGADVASLDTSLADDDARTRHPADTGVADAGTAGDEYQDLPWLTELTGPDEPELAPTGAAEDTAVAEEPHAATDRMAPADAEADSALDLESGAAGDGALDVAEPAIDAAAHRMEAPPPDEEAYAVAFDVVEEVPTTAADDAVELEAPAEPVAEELQAAQDSVPFAGEEQIGAAEYVPSIEPLEDVSESLAAADALQGAPEVAPATTETPPVAVFEEMMLIAQHEAVDAEVAPGTEPGRDTFAEDVEAEPDLAAFRESGEAESVPEVALADYLADYHDETVWEDAVAADSAEAEYLEDVEAESELADADVARFAAADETAPERPDVPLAQEAQQGRSFADRIDVDRDWLDELESEPAEAVTPFDSGSLAGASPPSVYEDAAAVAGDVAWDADIAATGGPEPESMEPLAGAIEEAPEPWQGAAPPPPLAEAERSVDTPAEAPAAGSGTWAEDGRATSVTDLGTETLADLYLAQGFAERAAEVYRALLSQRPGDERLTSKLRDAEAALASGPGGDVEDAGEVWLRGVESAWTGGAGATREEPTPYAWTEREEREQGTGIGAYLRELIGWGTGEAARLDVSAAEPPSEAVDQDARADERLERSVPAESGTPAASEPWAAEADGTTDREEPTGTTGAPAESPTPAAWELMTEPVLEEDWNAAGATDAWAAPVEEPPADPWLASEPSSVHGGPSEPASRAAAANPVEEAFNEWFGPPEERAAPAGDSENRAQRADAGSAEPGASEEEQDEDLEMFRAWLQSLKK